jgi:methylated-DNA-[protein]-cysteine S-methyltransferase
VGQALARNPLSIVIPCHRVISSNGSLGGYGGGVEIKEILLRLEQASSIKVLVKR